MSDPTITCPNCGTAVALTESLAAPLIAATRQEYEARLEAERRGIAEREAALAAARAELDERVQAEVAALRATVAAEEAGKAQAAAAEALEAKSREAAELAELLRGRDEKLRAAQEAQAEALRKERALEDARRELELTVERRVGEALDEARARARAEAEEALRLKVSERDTRIAGLQRQIEELRRRAEQGSQQLQGEVLELDLEATLRRRFPADRVEPVPKGEAGGDVLQHVTGPGGQPCGTILWETKRTRNWSDAWLAKLRDDQRAAGADVALLVSQALPQDIESFGLVGGVWVAGPVAALPLAVALRQSLVGIATARAAGQGRGAKTEMVYDYLTGPRFRQRVEAIIEKFSDMRADLDRERRATMRLWAKREAQIQAVIEATAGMYGDLQGIAGRALEEIEGLEVPLIGDGTGEGP